MDGCRIENYFVPLTDAISDTGCYADPDDYTGFSQNRRNNVYGSNAVTAKTLDSSEVGRKIMKSMSCCSTPCRLTTTDVPKKPRIKKDECRIEDYFVPLTDAISDTGSYADLDDYNDFAKNIRNNVKCKKASTRLDDSELGMMKSKTCSSKPRRSKTTDIPKKSEAVLLKDCCHHGEGPQAPRKFICNFGPNAVNAESDCLMFERSRCQAFWKFIDGRADLLDLIRGGEFEHLNPPQPAILQKKDLSERCKDAAVLRAKNKALHDDERARATRRKKMIEELQRKSGQLVHKPETKKNYSYPTAQSFTQIVKEMDNFDSAVRNPMGTKVNPLSPSDSVIAGYLSNEEDEESLESEEEHFGELGSEDNIELEEEGSEHRDIHHHNHDESKRTSQSKKHSKDLDKHLGAAEIEEEGGVEAGSGESVLA